MRLAQSLHMVGWGYKEFLVLWLVLVEEDGFSSLYIAG